MKQLFYAGVAAGLLALLIAPARANWTWDKSVGTLTADGAGATPAGTVLATQTTGPSYGHGIERGQIEVKAPSPGVRTLDLSEPVVDTDGNAATIQAIQKDAFKGDAALRRATFPAELKYIGESAFQNCASLEGIGALPSGLVGIGAAAFQNCPALVSQISLPSGLTELGAQAFQNTRVSGDIVLPAGMTELPDYAFAGTRVTSFRADADLVAIGRHAFDGCTALHTAVLDEGLTTLGAPEQQQDNGRVFYGCTALVSCNLPSTLVYVGSQCFQGSALSGDVVWPAGVEDLRANTFAGTRISSFVATTGLKTVGSQAFQNCANLSSVVLPDTLRSIPANWAQGVSGLSVYWRVRPEELSGVWGGYGRNRTHYLARGSKAGWEAYAASEANAGSLVLPSDDNATPGSWGTEGGVVLWWDDVYVPADPIGLFVR